MVRETPPDDIGVSVSYPLPGTKFHQREDLDQLGLQEELEESGDLAMMFRGAYTTEFIARSQMRCTGNPQAGRKAGNSECVGEGA